MSKHQGPRVLFLDIETAPLITHVWRLWNNDSIGLNQVQKDWHLLSWSAKWLDDSPSKIMYMDQRKKKDVSDDKDLAVAIWKLLDEADIVITQNGKSFDVRKLNAKFIEYKLQPPSSFKQIDTKVLSQKLFDFPSHRLEYMTEKLNKKYKKLKHKEYPGHEMWTECLKGNLHAWKCMEKYNKHDVLALEELYGVFAPWDTSINFDIYHDTCEITCTCGSKEFKKYGFAFTNKGKFQRYQCKSCGRETRDTQNLFSKEKRASLRGSTIR